ncbi:MAG: S-ribosylhomocysteine lyase [Monoglobaceae bacterium]
MEKIKSFTVDHTKLNPGIYISRIDGDITTYDLRMRKPNSGDLISNAAMHSLEHMFATLVRNSEMGGEVIYFGPMGCQTGFYLLMRSTEHGRVIELVKSMLKGIIAYDGEMPGCSEVECGNYRNLDLTLAKAEAGRYLDTVKDWTDKDLEYEK